MVDGRKGKAICSICGRALLELPVMFGVLEPLLRSVSIVCVAVWISGALIAPVRAATIITLNYTATYLGIKIGAGNWQINWTGDQFAISAASKINGVMSVLINGQGSAHAQGTVAAGRLIPNMFDSKVASTAEDDDIRIAFQAGVVKSLSALPPFPPTPKRVPLTNSDFEGVIDPLSASVVVSDRSDLAGSACGRRVPVFDGRRRYDVDLAFKTTERIVIPRAYHGVGILCAAHLLPIAGQQTNSALAKYLVESDDLEIEFAFIPEARMLVPVRASIPTLIGTVHVMANRIQIESSSDEER